ncbi:LacI family transcriptional regulator [Rhodoferax ferrireducens]|uniref:LacI family transcriptional regulator n=1 Tax=Rhodoferax ferrireducens TaxID=192843 RepID=A0ABU2CBY8_9BURK|nr:LacI family DNA-binding transcriptional regulator [Rhodoferax ferrireducens]MDR7378840.1 LacI family transcriptional regulator [Rhodoferax ferrireducens]
MSNTPHPSRITIADVAKAAGVSLSTVDRVLNGRAPVRLDTAQRIHAVAESIGFHAAGVIRERVHGKRVRHTLGFLLQRTDAAFYQELGESLALAAQEHGEFCTEPQIDYMDDLSPEAVSLRLRDMGERVDAVALIAVDHPLVWAEVERLKAKGVPVFAVISDLSTPARAGYAGLDNRSVGRTAAWFITRLAREPGKLATFVGSHRFQCQEVCEMSFRSFVREHAPGFELMEPLFTLENDQLAEEGARDLLHRHPDIVGVFVAGSGIDGVVRALREHYSGAPGTRPICVVRELTQHVRQGLRAGDLHAALSHPLPRLANGLVEMMINVLNQPGLGLQQCVVPLDTQTPESV